MKQPLSLDPIHPGEILLKDFMKPLGSALINWLAIWMFRPIASARSSTAFVRLPPTRRCGSGRTFVFRLKCGLDCRSIMLFG